MKDLTEAVSPSGADERVKTEVWREHVLFEAGYPAGAAHRLALLHHVDLHVACDLVKRGCPPFTAEQILS